MANQRAYDITTMFIKSYPPAKMPVVITVTKFDMWAQKNHLYRYADDSTIDATSTAAINQARNVLRQKINDVACSDSWRLAGNTPFHLHVRNHGVDYQMTDIETAFDTKTKKMPVQIKGFTTAKDRRIEELRVAIDPTKLTEEQRITIGSYTRVRAMIAHMVTTQMDMFENELEEIVKHQQRRKIK